MTYKNGEEYEKMADEVCKALHYNRALTFKQICDVCPSVSSLSDIEDLVEEGSLHQAFVLSEDAREFYDQKGADKGTRYFVFPDEAHSTAIPCSEEQADGTDGRLGISVTETEKGDFVIEASQWYSDDGVCRLTVSWSSLETVLPIFRNMVSAFEEAYSE